MLFRSLSGIASNSMNAVLAVVMPIIHTISSAFNGLMSGIHAVGHAASSIGHAAAHAIGLHVVIPSNNKEQRLFATPKRQSPQSFMSLGNSLNSLKGISQQVSSIGQLTSNDSNFSNLDINALVDKVVNKLSNAIIKSNSDKTIQTSINIDGKEVAKATSKPLNNIQNSNQFILKRNGGY